VVGSRLVTVPNAVQLLRKAHAAGHLIGIHSWSHTALTTLSNEQIVAECAWTAQAIYDAIGVWPKYVRPPFGDIDPRVRAVLLSMGLAVAMWNRDALDRQGSGTDVARLFQTWAQEPAAGVISLGHDLYETAVAQAPAAIDAVLRTGKFAAKTVAQCRDDSQPYLQSFLGSSTSTDSNGGRVIILTPPNGGGSRKISQIVATPNGAGSRLGISSNVMYLLSCIVVVAMY
jgi:Polysaccharide deacetylase